MSPSRGGEIPVWERGRVGRLVGGLVDYARTAWWGLVGGHVTEKTRLELAQGVILRDAPGTGSAACFFINTGNNTFLDHGGTRNPDGQGYAVFGQVVSGMDVVRAIQARETKGKTPIPGLGGQYLTEPVTIKKAYRQ